MSGGEYAVIGAGASGTMQAVHLLRCGARRVTLIEREREAGRGTAYGTRRPEHLLNVTARRMIVDPQDPGQFERWQVARGGGPDDYAQRREFGAFLREWMESVPGLDLVSGEAIAIDREGDREKVSLADGRSIFADAAILALGNLRPAAPRPLQPEKLAGVWIDDPWFGDLSSGLSDRDVVLLVGSGLTAVDAALTLDALGFRGRILGISRRGPVPRAHLRRETTTERDQEFTAACVDLLRDVRRRAAEIGWREAVHEARTVAQTLWGTAPLAERRRFLRHLRPWWDVHRHRIAPAVAERIEEMQREDRLAFRAGRIGAVERRGDHALVTWRPRGAGKDEQLEVKRIVNCSGPELDIERAGDPLLSSLLESGRARPDSCRLGLDVDRECRILDAGGEASPTLLAIGPMTRGAFWESIAVSEIAVQALGVARSLEGSC